MNKIAVVRGALLEQYTVTQRLISFQYSFYKSYKSLKVGNVWNKYSTAAIRKLPFNSLKISQWNGPLCYMSLSSFRSNKEPFAENIENGKTLTKKSNLFFLLCQNIPLGELKGSITRGRLARLAGLARFAGISARLWNTLKINFAITWKKFSPVGWDPGMAMPGSRLAGMKIYHVVAIAGPHQKIDSSLSI